MKEIPKAHYKMYFISPVTQKENLVLLDVLYEKNTYAQLKSVPVKTNWLHTSEPYLTVQVPTVEAILGDKITAFAPNTTGIKYQTDKELEIVKQLFDVSNLIDQAQDLTVVKKSFENTVLKEIGYRKLELSSKDVVEDIFQTALILARNLKIKDEPDKSKFNELQTGLKKVINYLIFRNFRLDSAIEAAAKTAWFTQLLLQEKFDEFMLYSNEVNIAVWNIENTEFNFINRFKKTNKPAFYYWYHAVRLLNK